MKGGERSAQAGGQEGGQPDEQGQDPLAPLAGTQQCCPFWSQPGCCLPSFFHRQHGSYPGLVPFVSLPKRACRTEGLTCSSPGSTWTRSLQPK